MKRNEEIVAVDLFCGAGGLTYGLRRGGIRVTAGIDLDPQCQYAFETNNPGTRFVKRDIEALTAGDLEHFWGNARFRVLAGCAPCQPFSTYSQGKNIRADTRWRLLYEFSRLATETLPQFVTMENVPSLKRRKVFRDFISNLKTAGYDVWFGVVNCADLGLPQNRHRLVLVASRVGEAPTLKGSRTQKKTVSDAISRMDPLIAGESSEADPLHRCASLSLLNAKRIRASIPGGTWRDWPTNLVAKCHKRVSGDGYQAVYGRMSFEEPAPTITTQCYNYGSGRFGHPEQDRPISLREAAVLQGFPSTYAFESNTDKLTTRDIAKMIGNAVPPPLGSVLARTLIRSTKHLCHSNRA